jgi:O-acetyl-ADP-ribose deacetylase (regulator of RNase III)
MHRWTNSSVVALAGESDPIQVLTHKARIVVMQAMDAGWIGPPFDPIELAEHLRIPVTPRDDVVDARTVPVGKSGVCIEFNPNRPRQRVWYSIAHEIAHTLFPDCANHVRNRAAYHEMTGDDWQLESLCNIGAAELLMPAGSLAPVKNEHLTMERLVHLRREYAVSTEAMIIRMARIASIPCAAFCASAVERGSHADRYRLDYIIGSSRWAARVARGIVLPEASVVAECTGVGFTARRREQWAEGINLSVECIGIPAYPGRRLPRVVGVLSSGGSSAAQKDPLLSYVRGDATQPRGEGPRIIAHIVNDATPNWGGGGFASAVQRKWPVVRTEFREWSQRGRDALTLGNSHYTSLSEDLGVFNMVAQRGYGESSRPRIRYAALAKCLAALGDFAASRGAHVHMPRIGTGQAGGSWEIIGDMILESVCASGIPVTVYDPPNRVTPKSPAQGSLPLPRSR